MTEKQKRFVDEYLIDFNATRAYKVAYPHIKKDPVAGVMGSRLLKNDSVRAYIAKRTRDRQRRTEVTQDMVVNELAAIAFSKATDYAKIVEKNATEKIDGDIVPVYDADGKPVTYRTVELEPTENLTDEQKRALAVIKKGRDGIEVKPCDKVKALELLGRHLGMWNDKLEVSKPLDDTVKELEAFFDG